MLIFNSLEFVLLSTYFTVNEYRLYYYTVNFNDSIYLNNQSTNSARNRIYSIYYTLASNAVKRCV
jgi:spore germination protein GerM